MLLGTCRLHSDLIGILRPYYKYWEDLPNRIHKHMCQTRWHHTFATRGIEWLGCCNSTTVWPGGSLAARRNRSVTSCSASFCAASSVSWHLLGIPKRLGSTQPPNEGQTEEKSNNRNNNNSQIIEKRKRERERVWVRGTRVRWQISRCIAWKIVS